MSLPVELFNSARRRLEDPPISDGDNDTCSDLSDDDCEPHIPSSSDEECSDSASDTECDNLNRVDDTVEKFVLGRDKITKWYAESPRPEKDLQPNIVHEEAGVHSDFPTRSEYAAFNFFITDEIIAITLKATNQRGSVVHGANWKNVNAVELMGWLGLHIRCGVDRDNFRHIDELFSAKTGPPIYQATMSRARFLQIKKCIRFDDMNTRMERKSGEQGWLAPIHDVFERFVEACQVNYKASAYVTIDELLLPFRGKCPFKVYMPQKTDKYGIKVWSMADATNAYLLNAQIYREKVGQAETNPQRVVHDLIATIENTGRNVTTGNLFTDFSLAKSLLDKNLTLLGTLRRNKPEIPSSFKRSKGRKIYSTEFGFSKEERVMICSYVPKKGKAVLMLSSMHFNKDVQEKDPFKPHVILDYDATKGGVDQLDVLVKNYTCKRISNRWPLVVFYWMVDIAGYNSFVSFTEKNPTAYEGPRQRRKFLTVLAERLCLPQIKQYSQSYGRFMPCHVKMCVKAFLNREDRPSVTQSEGEEKKRKCGFCSMNINKKKKKSCTNCDKPICAEHSYSVCTECLPYL
ncbi:piggyBac transposable element-derived protein 4 isoform X2 [Procambarus clarkii]